MSVPVARPRIWYLERLEVLLRSQSAPKVDDQQKQLCFELAPCGPCAHQASCFALGCNPLATGWITRCLFWLPPAAILWEDGGAVVGLLLAGIFSGLTYATGEGVNAGY